VCRGVSLDQRVSGLIGVVGGLVDIIVGVILLQQPMETQPMMQLSPTSWVGYFLLALGVIVLLSGMYLLTARMMKRRTAFGVLMILYGIVMLALGAGMLGQMFSMMEGFVISGTVMIIIGLAMLYSGYDMTRM
jgi:drug/metabolite transporter (DMT)-like permease